MKKIQTGDNVIITAGKHKGAKSVVLMVHDDKVLIKGVNIVKRATKKQWFIQKEAPLHISNVALYDTKSESASRVGIKIVDGKRMRYYKKSNEIVKKS